MNAFIEDLMSRKKEITLLFAIVPLFLLLLFLLPQEIKQGLALDVSRFSPQSIFLSHYVHEEFPHFSQNVLGYYIGMFLVYGFYFLRRGRGILRTLFPLFVILPFVSSFLHLAGLPTSRSLGYSAIVAAIYGALPVVFFGFTEFRYKLKLNRTWSLWSLFFISMLLIAMVYGHLYITLMVGVATAFFLLMALRFAAKNNDIMKFIHTLCIRDRALLVFGLSFSILSAAVFFPANIVSENGVVNIFSHYVGYVFGFVTFWILYARMNNGK